MNLFNVGRADEGTATVWLSDESKWDDRDVRIQARKLCDDLCNANLVNWARVIVGGKVVYNVAGMKA